MAGASALPPRILIVEDDAALAEEMAQTLSDYGMRPGIAASWEAAVAAVEAAPPDLVVLDQRLGHVDTLPRIGALRALTSATVLVLTGNRAETDRIVALEIGADDFLLKPISGRELVARIRAHLRRGQAARPAAAAPAPAPAPAQTAAQALPQGDALPGAAGWRLLPMERALRRADGSPVPLTGAEFDLLALLAETPGVPVDRETLTQRVLRRPWRAEDRALDNLVLQLRRKMGPGGDRVVLAVRGQGYSFAGFPRG
ncbi:response regulator transcription factor [Falsiroseomonas selenitidurans]|uniref:Response regulator transcription factor n=1 Tax=Falsiroseomonas selenitidurans TaxID=2716335 RepID=A0ABX1DX72_9PROT|nr:response regulator transcription factor [Falsiroseomonas selenitidurans]NKC29493.1 response regulator transcription factor [Falsiroseomonas selenitidurans]